MISHNSIKEKIRETLPKTQRKIPQNLAALRDLFGGRYRTRTCDPLHVNRNLNFFIIFSVRFGRFRSVIFDFQHFLSPSFPHIPRRFVAVCVVSSSAAEQIQHLPTSEQDLRYGQGSLPAKTLSNFAML